MLATIEGKIKGLKMYLTYANPYATETIKETEIEVKCLEKLLNELKNK
jgi:uncharacterized lipoprotein YehR (DUF1307 family)